MADRRPLLAFAPKVPTLGCARPASSINSSVFDEPSVMPMMVRPSHVIAPYTRSAMPLVGWTVSNEWYRTGRFLARSITEFAEENPLPVQVRWWQEAGMRRVRTKLLSNGAAVVTWAVKTTPVLGEEPEDLAHPDG